MSGILYEETPLVVNPELARVIGLNEAIVLQQLHYWIAKNINIRDGKSWVYNTIQEWREQFSFWSINTIRRTLEGLQKDGIVFTANYNERKFDKTLWYTINYEALDVIVKNRKSNCPKWANAVTQNGQKHVPKMGEPIPENTIDYTKTTTPNGVSACARNTKPRLLAEVEAYTASPALQEALIAFIEAREVNRKKLTLSALQLNLKKLSGLAKTDEGKIAIVNQSIERGWQGLFVLKEQGGGRDNSMDALQEALNAVKGR